MALDAPSNLVRLITAARLGERSEP